MAGFVAPDAAEDLLEHRMARGARHPVEQRRGRDFAHHEGSEKHGERILGHGAVEAGPVAAAVMVEPIDVVERGAFEFGRAA